MAPVVPQGIENPEEFISVQSTKMASVVSVHVVKDAEMEYKEMTRKFENFWPVVVEEIRRYLNEATHQFAPTNRLFNLLEENVPDGKKSRGLIFVNLFRALKPNRTEKEDQEAYLLGWCIELVQAACLIADDMIDNSETRRGKPCWFRNEHVGRHAINDVLFLENIVNGLVDRWFLHNPFYPQLSALMNQTKMTMIIGEDWDSQMEKGTKQYSMFNEAAYKGIVDMKTGYYTFYAPVGMALVLAMVKDPLLEVQLQELMLRFGYFFQAQDDYLDCFGDPAVTGKVGTDITDGKCTWLAVKALEVASPEQADMFKDLYGKHVNEDQIKNLYRDLKIPEMYSKLEEDEYRTISEMIKALPSKFPQFPFFQLLKSMVRRRK